MVKTAKLDKMSGVPDVLSGFLLYLGGYSFVGTKRTFTEGKIFSPLISFAFPVLIALFLQAMYGAVDLWVVGKFGSAADVSAVATGGQVTYTVTVVIVGLSMGITVLIGQKNR